MNNPSFSFFILAGGYGSRFLPITQHLPKPLIPLNGKTLLSYHLDWMQFYQYQEIYVNASYHAQALLAYLNSFPVKRLKVLLEHYSPWGVWPSLRTIARLTSSEYLFFVSADLFFPSLLANPISFETNRSWIVKVKDDFGGMAFLPAKALACSQAKNLAEYLAQDLPKNCQQILWQKPCFNVGTVDIWAQAQQHIRECLS